MTGAAHTPRAPLATGVYKCVSADKSMGSLPIGTECYNEYKVDKPWQKDPAEGEK